MSLFGLMLEVQEAVKALGVRCIISPNDLNPPCVLVGAPTDLTTQAALGGGMACRIPLEVIATGQAANQLEWLLDTVELIHSALPVTTAGTVIYRLSDGRELPSYTLTLEGNT
jgi:hypothetical protein